MIRQGRSDEARGHARTALAAVVSLAALAALGLGDTPATAAPALDGPRRPLVALHAVHHDGPPPPAATEAPPLTTRPGASLLLGRAPREVAFVLDGAARPALRLLTTFRDASIERWGPLRVYTNGRWGDWLGDAWWSYEWAPRLGPGDDELAAGDDVERPSRPGNSSDEAMMARVAGAFALPGPGEDPTPPAWLRDRAWLDAHAGERFRPLERVFDTIGPNLASDGFDAIFLLPPKEPVRDWRCRRRPVTIIRYGAESDTLELVRCDGSIPAGTHDRLSILARPPEVPRPADGLPDEPDPVAWASRHEWLPDVRLVHPRLLWALQRLVDDFPRRQVYLVSGYRPLARVGGGTMDDDASHGHRSLHADGRALDLYVQGVPHEEIFKACRALKDVGCGFYPNSKFVHVDVRRAHTGQAFWIDASAPGEPSRYVDSWPGVVESGAMGWLAPDKRVAGP